MWWRFGGFVFSIGCGLLAFTSCTNDYDEFEFVDETSTGGSPGGSGGSSAVGGGGVGGIIGGSGGIPGGTGGIISGGTGGVAGTPAGGGTGGSTGCPVGQKTCAGGCVDITDPAYGCGTSGCDPCVIANAQTQCVTNLCALFKCNDGFENCNGTLTDGCESTLDTITDCGDCGRACSTTNSVSATCTGGKCSHICTAGFADCTQPPSPVADDGCEVDLASSATSCGACGNNCTLQGAPAGGGFECKSGACGCGANLDCYVGGDSAKAECDATTSVCKCSSLLCNAGETCQKSGPSTICRCNNTGNPCTAGWSCCPGTNCKNLQTDAANCGGCGRACPAGFVCAVGACACDGDDDCNAGSAGTCTAGVCVCGTTTCTAGQRCTAAGTCG